MKTLFIGNLMVIVVALVGCLDSGRELNRRDRVFPMFSDDDPVECWPGQPIEKCLRYVYDRQKALEDYLGIRWTVIPAKAGYEHNGIYPTGRCFGKECHEGCKASADHANQPRR